MAVTESTGELAETQITESEARRHLDQVLASPVFAKTKRHARFLRFVVDKTFEGHADEIKERTLGIEIFDRNPSYDLSDDPIVRVTAGDIRKRLLQYYREGGEHDRLRLELPTGSYVPVFRPRPVESLPLPPATTPLVEPQQEQVHSLRSYWMVGLSIVLASLVLLVGFLFGRSDFHRFTPAERDLRAFWAPLEARPDGVIGIVVGDLTKLNRGGIPLPEQFKFQMLGSRAITGPGNTYALSQLAARMGADHQQVRAYMADNVNLSDLRAQPSVLIGAYDNIWTARLLEGARFTMQADFAKNLLGIRDSTQPNTLRWPKSDDPHDTASSEDFAVVTRKRSPLTDQMFIAVSGIGAYGTVAAAEFVSHPEYFEQFARTAPANWQQKDLQIVIAVDVVDGRTSPPRVLSYSLE